MFPLDDGAVNRIKHLYVPWTAWRAQHRLRPGAKVHEVAGPNLAGGFRMVAAFTAPLDADASGVLCEQGDWIVGLGLVPRGRRAALVHRGQVRRTRGPRRGAPGNDADRRRRRDRRRPRRGRAVRRGTEIGRASLGVPVPLAWSPDGAFLTVGYGRPFPVTDRYEPSVRAPASLLDVTITTGPPPPLDLDAELARVMRHQ